MGIRHPRLRKRSLLLYLLKILVSICRVSPQLQEVSSPVMSDADAEAVFGSDIDWTTKVKDRFEE